MSALSKLRRNIFELQPLEIRRLLTTATLDTATQLLTVTGTSNSDTITLSTSSTGRLQCTGINGTFPIGGGSGVRTISGAGAGGEDTNENPPNTSYGSSTNARGAGGDARIGGKGPHPLKGNEKDDRPPR